MQLREAPATNKQTWYLFTLTDRDYRAENLTMAEASTLIKQVLNARRGSANETPSTQPSKPSVPRAKAKSKITKPKPVKALTHKPPKNGFCCWYCLDGHEHQDVVINDRQFYTLCLGCNATTADVANYRLKRNKLGGCAGAVLGNGKARQLPPDRILPLPDKFLAIFKPQVN